MNLLITGSAGFLGSEVTKEALRRNHAVTALVLPGAGLSCCSWVGREGVRIVEADLREEAALPDAIRSVNVVIHLAASMSGSLEQQIATTVRGTKNLISAMHAVGLSRLVCISSFSVYDHQRLRAGDWVNEESPLETEPTTTYSRAKLMQEELVTGDPDLKWTILRPGVVFGPGRLWTDRLGIRLRPRLWLCIGSSATLPLTYVKNCAHAVVLAAERNESIGQVINIVDDGTLTQKAYRRELKRCLKPPPTIIPFPLRLFQYIATCARFLRRVCAPGRDRHRTVRSEWREGRCKPLRYRNGRLHTMLGWTQIYSLRESLDRSCEERESR